MRPLHESHFASMPRRLKRLLLVPENKIISRAKVS